MATSFFFKELVSNGVIVGGKFVGWETLEKNRGVLATDDPAIIAGLNAVNGRFGVVKITEQEYNEIKKAVPSAPLPIRQADMLRLASPPDLQRRLGAPAAEAKTPVTQSIVDRVRAPSMIPTQAQFRSGNATPPPRPEPAPFPVTPPPENQDLPEAQASMAELLNAPKVPGKPFRPSAVKASTKAPQTEPAPA